MGWMDGWSPPSTTPSARFAIDVALKAKFEMRGVDSYASRIPGISLSCEWEKSKWGGDQSETLKLFVLY